MGTEEGYIYKCSFSHTEQHVQSYAGHIGPVYKVRWSPFYDQVFLSAGSDWSVKLWQHTQSNPVMTFQVSHVSRQRNLCTGCKLTVCLQLLQNFILDISWSPYKSTVFVSSSENGRLEVWDLESSVYAVVFSLSHPNR